MFNDLFFPVLGGGQLGSGFGPRAAPCPGCSTNHGGIDIRGTRGTPIIAPIGGNVTFAGTRGGYGNQVRIMGSDGIERSFSHLDTIGVRPGMNLNAGQQLGTLGQTGRVTGPHLHYETLRGGQRINPASILAGGSVLNTVRDTIAGAGDSAQRALENIPGMSILFGARDSLLGWESPTGSCGLDPVCAIRQWIEGSGFFQRLAIAVLAFIILLAAFYLMKGNADNGRSLLKG